MTKTGYLALLAVAALALYGCGGQTKTGAATTTEKTAATDKTAASAKSGDAHAHDHDHGAEAKKEGSALGGLAKDVTSSAKEGAEAVKDAAAKFANPAPGKCPVGGEDIDPAVTAEVDGKTYAFCCENCIDKFKADPKKFLTAK